MEEPPHPAPLAPPAAAPASHPAPAKQKKTKKLPKQHRVGNFRSYYAFRLGQSRPGALEDDPRLAVLDAAWFRRKRGLDIGCNSGDLTIAIAKKFEPAYILGIDVDPQLVSRARANLKELLQQERVQRAFETIPASDSARPSGTDKGADAEASKKTPHAGDGSEDSEMAAADSERPDAGQSRGGETLPSFADEMPLSFRLWKAPVQSSSSVPKSLGKVSTGSSFPANVVFKREDIVKDTHAGKAYDFITCFSVTKWIHLFHGDDGLKKVFAHIHALLAPGGRFIVEPQPWKSYHKRKFTSETTAANYHKIELRPKDFPAFLVDTVGFAKCTFLQVCRTSANGFRRPVYVVEK